MKLLRILKDDWKLSLVPCTLHEHIIDHSKRFLESKDKATNKMFSEAFYEWINNVNNMRLFLAGTVDTFVIVGTEKDKKGKTIAIHIDADKKI